MAYSVLLGTSAWDAVAYARALSNDVTPPYLIPDSSYVALQEDVVEDISRFLPLDYVIGTPATNTSPLNTVSNTQRYVCNSANGFTVEPTRITDVTYAASASMSNTNDWGSFNLMPFSPMSRFFSPMQDVIDNPSMLTLRSQYRDTLDRVFSGGYLVTRDPSTGRLALDLYPIPSDAQPIYVRYQGSHLNVPADTGATYPTIPEAYKRQFAKLLYCLVVEQNLDLFSSSGSRIGILTESVSPGVLERKIDRIRSEVYNSLGGTFPVVVHAG